MIAGALIVLMADHIGWRTAYLLVAVLMAVTLAAISSSLTTLCSLPIGGARRDFSPIGLDGKRAE